MTRHAVFFVACILMAAALAPGQTVMFDLHHGALIPPAVDGGRDVDADGFPDFVFGATGLVLVVSGCDGSTLHTFTDPDLSFGRAVALADVDGDGHADVAIGRSGLPVGRVEIFSGATGSLIRTITPSAPFSEDFGSSISRVDDVDGDGIADLAVGDPRADPIVAGSNPDFRRGRVAVLSGATGSLVTSLTGITPPQSAGTNPPPAGFGVDVAGIADLDGNGAGDVVVGVLAYGEVRVHDGASGALIRSLVQTTPRYGAAVADAGDADGDGVHDIVVGAAPSPSTFAPTPVDVYLYSGATGAMLRSISPFGSGSNGVDVAGFGDVDGDGFDDVGISELGDAGFFGIGAVHVVSGANGALIATIVGNGIDPAFGSRIAPAGDVNQDGRGDVLLGKTAGAEVASVLALGPALIVPIAPACGNAAGPPPNLTATLPFVGKSMSVAVTNAPSPAFAFLFLSLPGPPVPFPTVPGCFAHLDLASVVPLAPIVPDVTGFWMLSGGIPNQPTADGVLFHMQGVFLPATGGFWVSNAIELRLGY